MNQYTNYPAIYLLRNKINNKIYIGKTMHLADRLVQHKHSPKNKPNSCVHLIAAIRKYGWENFHIEILESFEKIDNRELLAKESEWIKKLNATDRTIGYNICAYSNDVTGHKLSDETKQKLSKSRKGKYIGKNNPFFGKKHTVISKQKMSEKQKLIARRGPAHHNFGKKFSLERCKQMSLQRLGQDASDKKKAVYQIDKKTDKIIKLWPSLAEASKGLTGTNKYVGTISQVCNNRKNNTGHPCKTTLGFKWKFVDPLDQLPPKIQD